MLNELAAGAWFEFNQPISSCVLLNGDKPMHISGITRSGTDTHNDYYHPFTHAENRSETFVQVKASLKKVR